MKKVLAAMFFSFSLGLSPVVALESSVESQSFKSLSAADSAMLFGTQNVDVAVLSDEEMKETKGEGFFTFVGGTILGWAIEKALDKIFD